MVRLGLLSAFAISLSGMSQALRVPADLAPGVYSIPFDSNGVATGDPIRLGPLSARARHAIDSRQTQPLPSPQTRCQSSGDIIVADFDAAMADFQRYCDGAENIQTQRAVIYTT